MSIEFRIKQNGEKHCYSNWTMNLKSFLTALYSNENPYEALMSLDRNNQLSDDNYTRDKRNGLITYDIDFDRDTITRHEKGRQFKMNEMSKIPLGAAYSLMRFHGAGVPAAVSDCEYDEYNDMSGLFGNRDSEIKDRGFVIYGNDEYFEAYLNYLRIVNPCKITKQQFIESEMCTEEIYEFLAISFVHGISQVYAGATGSGKTTIMADIMSNIPDHRRLITIEKSVREFDLVKRDENGRKINNVVHLVTYESDDPTRCVTMQDLLTKCLTMHPDAICVAEMKNEEAWEAQEAARTGHTVLTTTHASSVQGIYPRLATLCMQKHSTPYPTLISFVTEAFPLAVFLKKLDDGKRHIMEIAECLGCDEKGKVFTKTLWKYRVDSERIVDGKTVIDGRFVRVNPISKELRERMHENGVPNDVLDRFSEVR